MNKIFYFCFAIAALLSFSSCDKDADNKNIVKVSGLYTGNVESYLYVPDYFTELENVIYYTTDLTPALAGDVETKAEVNFGFSSEDLAVVSINKLTGIHFEVQILAKDINGEFVTDDEGRYVPRSNFAQGALAQILEIVKECVSVNEYNVFALNYMGLLVDDLQFANIKTKPLVMKESGAFFTSYDFEQNSFYERFAMEPFTFERQSSFTETLHQLDLLKAAHPVEFAPYESVLNEIASSFKTQGTISDASGWCTLTYANYHPRTVLTFHKATGLIDALSTALFGKNKDGEPDKELWLMMYYEGNINDMSSYEQVSDK